MNVERLTEIAEWLEAGAPARNGVGGFDMSDFSQPAECGTAFCIAGAVLQWHYPGGFEAADEGVESLGTAAGAILGLSYRQRTDLFFPSLFDTTDTEHAARVVRHLIATGEVDWNATREAA